MFFLLEAGRRLVRSCLLIKASKLLVLQEKEEVAEIDLLVSCY